MHQSRYDNSERTRDWHSYNIDLLKRLFTTSEIADSYDAVIKRVTTKQDYSSSRGDVIAACLAFLKELIDALNLYVPLDSSAMPSKTPVAPPQISSQPGESVASGQWEFGTIEVANPARDIEYGPSIISQPGVPKGIYNMGKTLEALATQGWELVSAVPEIQETSHDSIITITFRLFFKRPASLTR
jgi:hypothetical protein